MSLFKGVPADRPTGDHLRTENTVTGQDQQLWVGIDIGKRAHHAAAIDAEGTLVWSHRITNDQESIERIVALATSAHVDVRWAVDMTSHEAALLLGVLNSAGQRVQYVPGRIRAQDDRSVYRRREDRCPRCAGHRSDCEAACRHRSY
ncbi:transposase [Rhodococcus qingshengii]|uniref:IS110 family transposase n=1 Tax=Rhodococcus qingshengii TaxID=334542 RepID=UPI0037C83A97